MIGPRDLTDEGYLVLPFNAGKQGGRFLVTNDTGAWALLEPEEMDLLRTRRVESDPDLFSKLRSAGIIITKEDMPEVRGRMNNKFWFLGNGASLHVVAVTDRCNLKCQYCYAKKDEGEVMTTETAEQVADFITRSPSEMLIVEFSGGEPTTNFDAIKATVLKVKGLAKERGKQYGFAIVNNGTNLDKEKAKFIVDNNIGMCFSLDGPEDLHNLHRPYRHGGGSYEDVVKSIRRFKKMGTIGVRAIPVITRHSLQRGRDIVDEYLSHGIRIVRFKYLSYFGRAAEHWDELGYEPGEYLEAWKDVIDYMYELNMKGIEVRENMTQVIARKLFNRVDPGFCELQMPCGAGISQVAYAPDGSVHTCDEGRMFEEFKMGHVTQDYWEVMDSDVLKSMILESSGFTDICSECELKPFCGVCPLESYNLKGSMDSRVVFDRRHKVHEGMLRHIIQRCSDDPKFYQMLKRWSKKRRVAFYDPVKKVWG